MQNSFKEAKKRLIINVASNVVAVVANVGINIWMAPYLIRNLGREVYGMIPLVISFIAFFNLFTMSIVNAVSRYVSIYLGQDELEKGNVYFNSALSALLILCSVLLIPLIFLSIWFSDIFQVPKGFESDTRLMFIIVIFSSFFMVLRSPFRVSTFITHRFDLYNLGEILSKLLRIPVLVLCFYFFGPALKYFGLSFMAMACFALLVSMFFTKTLTPHLKINLKVSQWKSIVSMGKMSSWMTINEIGALLYLTISFSLINLFLGPEQVTRFSLIALWVTMLAVFGGTLNNIFTPVIYQYVAENRLDDMAIQARRAMKFIGLMMALPVGLLCGVSEPMLRIWVGESFTDLWPLSWLLVGPWLITIIARPVFSIDRGVNKVKVPAIVTLVVGVLNVILSIVLMKYTSLGIYGVALSLTICLVGKNFFFEPAYAASVIKHKKTIFIKSMLPGVIMGISTLLLSWVTSRIFDLSSILALSITCVFWSLLYMPFCFFVILNEKDKNLIKSLIKSKKQQN